MNGTEKRIVLDVGIYMHTEIKSRAARKNISMKAYILRAVMDAIRKEDNYNASPK